MKIIKLNIGSGETKLKGFINIDVEKKVKPDLLLNIKLERLPFRDQSVSQINCIHNLEHIELQHWNNVLGEFSRVLKKDGLLILAYPEFERCAKNFIENFQGLKEFWRDTLYGRQLYPGDYHVVPMVTKDIINVLTKVGFKEFKYCEEHKETYNTFMICTKGILLSREQLVKEEIFGK